MTAPTRTAADMLRVDQVARRLGVHVTTVRRYVKAGQLTAHLIGNRHLFDPADVEAFWQANVA